MKIKLTISSFLVIPFLALAQEETDTLKRKYHLFKSTPKSLMRDFETDRPDITESAYTVDAGHFQVETDVFKTERNKENGITSTTNYYNLANIKLGLTNSTDLQLVVSSFSTTTIENGISKNKSEDFAATTIRIKQNLWGNDGGKTALALLPYVNIPNQSNEKITGGIALPFALALKNNWGFGAQLQFDAAQNSLNNNYHLNFLSSATLAHSLFKQVNFFLESYTTQETELNRFEYFLNGGLIYKLGAHLKIDAGFNYGFKRFSNKVYFTGISFRY